MSRFYRDREGKVCVVVAGFLRLRRTILAQVFALTCGAA